MNLTNCMKTYSMRAGEIDKRWYVVDAKDLIVGRLAAVLANVLRGKHKPTYTPHMDCGDYVVVINADKVHFTGNKGEDKKFYWHTGHPGGVKERTMRNLLEGKFPERVIKKAVERMVPRGPLGRQQMSCLKVYVGSEHPHVAQNPQVLDVAAMNAKNVKRG